jgi:hypothetical protein
MMVDAGGKRMIERLRMGFLFGGGLVACAAVVAACSGGDHRHYPGTVGGQTGTPVPDDAGAAPTTGDGAPSATPLLVDVDPNQTLSAAPGQGAGVFIEYKTGGHWHVWWTCDTALTLTS